MASFETEWAQLKQGDSVGDGMRLAGAGGAAGWGKGAAGGVKSSKNAWNTAADGVGRLGGNVKQALTALEQGQKGTGAQGVLSAAAQREVYRSWKQYLDAMTGRCAALTERLEKAGNHQYKGEQQITEAFDQMKKQYEDTQAVGGRNAGR
ncbi:hypothetical protein [Streptomyces albireticuli]|nr:hypothetical protein [Streptomyces albireticuli]MCD9141432.1 hypothetical protein [Streptomyces albireticuli]MCD9160607.1 hypothetical protein [Streptomyces albireticuli]MCD9195837.1 hypothetical protein [Streptomyces albireticuli]